MRSFEKPYSLLIAFLFIMEKEVEIWKDITGYEGIYQVSNLGNVRSLNKVYFNGSHDCLRKGRLLKKLVISIGYHAVNLYKDNKSKQFSVHRLVAMHFIFNKGNKRCVNHINGIKTDNKVSNLEWCTHKENTIHAVTNKLLLPKTGVINGMCKLTEQNVLDIRDIGNSVSQRKLAVIYNVSHATINGILKNKTWTHL